VLKYCANTEEKTAVGSDTRQHTLTKYLEWWVSVKLCFPQVRFHWITLTNIIDSDTVEMILQGALYTKKEKKILICLQSF